MKFSILLPTRHGGPFLRNCISSVLCADYMDVELVVSDNANTDETTSILASFQEDPRLTCIRFEQPISVSENWNATLDASRGDYILMIGDDDCLLPYFFEAMSRVLEDYGRPDCVAFNAYSYVFPHSLYNNSCSYYREAHFAYEPGLDSGFLSKPLREAFVRDMFRYKVRYPLNMQLTLVSRRVVDRLGTPLFKPPFPDHYAINSVLLTAERFVYHPGRLLVVGLSPKSFGHFAYNGRSAGGMSYLGSEARFSRRLPGSELLNGMTVSLQSLLDDHPERLRGVSISRREYLIRQVYAWYLEASHGLISRRELAARCRLLRPVDWAGVLRTALDRRNLARATALWREHRDQLQVRWPGLQPLPGIHDIAEFEHWLATSERSSQTLKAAAPEIGTPAAMV